MPYSLSISVTTTKNNKWAATAYLMPEVKNKYGETVTRVEVERDLPETAVAELLSQETVKHYLDLIGPLKPIA
jgi:hypothetical protein